LSERPRRVRATELDQRIAVERHNRSSGGGRGHSRKIGNPVRALDVERR
jgi:hypothetical protein